MSPENMSGGPACMYVDREDVLVVLELEFMDVDRNKMSPKLVGEGGLLPKGLVKDDLGIVSPRGLVLLLLLPRMLSLLPWEKSRRFCTCRSGVLLVGLFRSLIFARSTRSHSSRRTMSSAVIGRGANA
tara:strand:- start:267 stop:650 length:384 start_codon:yes stop_codon:yes gene_type:complete